MLRRADLKLAATCITGGLATIRNRQAGPERCEYPGDTEW
jgi:hypothetical protein